MAIKIPVYMLQIKSYKVGWYKRKVAEHRTHHRLIYYTPLLQSSCTEDGKTEIIFLTLNLTAVAVRPGLVVTHWSRSTKLLYVGPGGLFIKGRKLISHVRRSHIGFAMSHVIHETNRWCDSRRFGRKLCHNLRRTFRSLYNNNSHFYKF